MNRRTFTKTLAGTVAGSYGLLLDPVGAKQSAQSGDREGKRTGASFDLSVMLWTVFNDLPFEKRLEKIAGAGYRNVELIGEYAKWTDADFERVNRRRKELGITFDCTAGLKYAVANPKDRQALVAELHGALPVMERIECPCMIVMSGDKIPGMARAAQHESCIEGLKAAAAVVEGKSVHGKPVRLLLETIDPEENPKYFLTEVREALEVVEAVGHPQVQLLYDMYHEQISAGNLIKKLEKSMPHLGLVHIADVPGRHQPGTGEINYENIFRKLGELNYTGMVAMEFHPEGDPVAELRTAREMAMRAGAEGARS